MVGRLANIVICLGIFAGAAHGALHPNATITIPERVIRASFPSAVAKSEEPFEKLSTGEREVVTHTGRGGSPVKAAVKSKGRFRGTIVPKLVPNDDCIEIELTLSGEVACASLSKRDGVSVINRTDGTTEIKKTLRLAPGSREWSDAQVSVALNPVKSDLSRISLMKRYEVERRLELVKEETQKLTEESVIEQLKKSVNESIAETVSANSDKLSLKNLRFSPAVEYLFGPMLDPEGRPQIASLRSSDTAVTVGIVPKGSEGAPEKCPFEIGPEDDLTLCVHDSFTNSSGQKMLAGKHVTDERFKLTSRLATDAVPLDLEVHDRTPRWSLQFAETDPLIVEHLSDRRVRLSLRFQSFKIDEEHVIAPVSVTTEYAISPAPYMFLQFERSAPVVIEGLESDPEALAFLQKKFDALWSPIIDFGGLSFPEGGQLGRLRETQVRTLETKPGWIRIGLEFADDELPLSGENARKMWGDEIE